VTLKYRLGVILGHWKSHNSKAWVYTFLFAFYSNYGRIISRLWHIFSVIEWCDRENWVMGCSRSLKMVPFDRHMIFYCMVRHCKYSSISYHFRVIWRWIILWPWNLGQRSLKIIETGTIRKLGTVSYSTSIVALCCIISEIKRDIGRRAIFTARRICIVRTMPWKYACPSVTRRYWV